MISSWSFISSQEGDSAGQKKKKPSSPRPPEPLVPLPPGGHDGRGGGLGLGNELDRLVDGGEGVEDLLLLLPGALALADAGTGTEQDQGVGSVLLAKGPDPAIGGPEEGGGRGGLEAQGGGRLGVAVGRLEEGEELWRQLEELVACGGGAVVEGDAPVGLLG